jgi:hypothetical protein
MAEKLDPKEMVTQKELVYSSLMQIEAITRLLLKKGIIAIKLMITGDSCPLQYRL